MYCKSIYRTVFFAVVISQYSLAQESQIPESYYINSQNFTNTDKQVFFNDKKSNTNDQNVQKYKQKIGSEPKTLNPLTRLKKSINNQSTINKIIVKDENSDTEEFNPLVISKNNVKKIDSTNNIIYKDDQSLLTNNLNGFQKTQNIKIILNKDDLLVEKLSDICIKNGWILIWRIKTPNKDSWQVPAKIIYSGDFIHNIYDLMQDIKDSGINLNVNIYKKNKVIVVDGGGTLITSDTHISDYE